ncbi:MAG: hypothetical protein ACRYGK_14775, partial [Janthinobacterium lividum]
MNNPRNSTKSAPGIGKHGPIATALAGRFSPMPGRVQRRDGAPHPGRHQDGGTVLGLIIGLIIGLSIAVGVAITIKNTPLPFNNKLGKQGRLAEPTPGQIADP